MKRKIYCKYCGALLEILSKRRYSYDEFTGDKIYNLICPKYNPWEKSEQERTLKKMQEERQTRKKDDDKMKAKYDLEYADYLRELEVYERSWFGIQKPIEPLSPITGWGWGMSLYSGPRYNPHTYV